MPQVSLKPQNYSLRDIWAGKLSESVRTRFDEMHENREHQKRDADSTKAKGRVPQEEAAKS